MGLRSRMLRSGPMWRKLVERSDTMIRSVLVAGSTAGFITCAGVKQNDKLVAVFHYTAGATLADLTSEFLGKTDVTGNGAVIQSDDQVNNTGGTDTSGDQLLVVWEAYDER